MKKQILLFGALILCTLFGAQQAKAETSYCPADTILYNIPESNEILCITKDYLSSTELATRPGFYAQFGLGYFAPTAAELPIRLGYDFGTFGEKKSIGLDLSAEANFQAGKTPAFSVAFSVIPGIYTYIGSFRFSAGLGIGFYYHDPSYNDYEDDDMASDISYYFALTPEFNFDWFLNNRLWMGFSLKTMMTVFKNVHHDYGDHSYSRYEYYDVALFPSIEAFHIGYKF